MLASGFICLVLALAVGGKTISDGKECGQIPSDVNISSIQSKHVPWVVRLSYQFKRSNGTYYGCVGSLVSPSIVLTAAHCTHKTHKPVEVHVDDCGDGTPCDISVASVTQHPAYTVFKSNQGNDVALVKLAHKVKHGKFACLPEGTTPPSTLVGKQTFVVGWHIHENGTDILTGGRGSAVRRVVSMPVMPTQQCEKVFGDKVTLQTSHLCAGGQGVEPCSGDAAAPLHVLEGSRATIVGIVSLGHSQCGSAAVPTIYSNIGAYVEWLKEQMADTNDQDKN